MLTEKDYLKKYSIKPVILSRGRADTITSHTVFPDWVEVLVPEEEKEQYKARISNPIITIPDEYQGLGQVRNWCLDNFTEETVIMIDDDIVRCYCLSYAKSKRVNDPEEIMQVLINTTVMSRDAGIHCFGYSQTDIRKYNACEPFRLCTWVGGVIGVNGRKFRFRDDKFKVDIDYCLQCLLVDRIIWYDARYLFSQKRDNNAGGNAKYRTEDEYQKSLKSLQNKWGEYLKVSKHKNQTHISINVKRRQSVEYRE